MVALTRFVAVPFVVLIATCSTALAQAQHIADVPTITATLAARAADEDASRAAVREALARQEVSDVASRMGVNLEQIEQKVQTLRGADLQHAAEWARQVNTSLVGGASTIVISTTAIIIALLIVLILVVAV